LAFLEPVALFFMKGIHHATGVALRFREGR
jgi:hypothetical protein